MTEQGAQRGAADNVAATVLFEVETLGLDTLVVGEQRGQRPPAVVGDIEANPPNVHFAGGELRSRDRLLPVGHEVKCVYDSRMRFSFSAKTATWGALTIKP